MKFNVIKRRHIYVVIQLSDGQNKYIVVNISAHDNVLTKKSDVILSVT